MHHQHSYHHTLAHGPVAMTFNPSTQHSGHSEEATWHLQVPICTVGSTAEEGPARCCLPYIGCSCDLAWKRGPRADSCCKTSLAEHEGRRLPSLALLDLRVSTLWATEGSKMFTPSTTVPLRTVGLCLDRVWGFVSEWDLKKPMNPPMPGNTINSRFVIKILGFTAFL